MLVSSNDDGHELANDALSRRNSYAGLEIYSKVTGGQDRGHPHAIYFSMVQR